MTDGLRRKRILGVTSRVSVHTRTHVRALRVNALITAAGVSLKTELLSHRRRRTVLSPFASLIL
eukprot:2689164-Pyramimonas_sp.AAC.1